MSWRTMLLIASGASAAAWQPALETGAPDIEEQLAQGWSPRPTQAPKALFGRMQVLPRQEDYTMGDGTCGFISSNGYSFTCIESSATCTFSDDYIGCCDPISDCNIVKTTCLDYNAVQDGECDLPDDYHTLCCVDTINPSCYTWTMSSTGTTDAYTFFECSPRAGSGVLLGYDPSEYTPGATDTEPGTGTGSETITQPRTETDSPGPTETGGSGGGGGGTNVGAIAGGAVGGVAALGLVGLAAFLLIRQKRKNKASHNASPSVQTVQALPPKTQSPSTPGTMHPGMAAGFQGPPPFDPRMSQGYPPQNQPWYAPQPGQHGGYGGVVYQPSSLPPHTTPSPGAVGSQGHTSFHDQSQSPASELQTIAPLGSDTNRAEMR